MEHQLEYIFVIFVYLWGSLLATWGDLGTLFGGLETILATLWAHIVAFQTVLGRPRCPKRHHHGYKVTLLATVLAPEQSVKRRGQRYPKQSL